MNLLESHEAYMKGLQNHMFKIDDFYSITLTRVKLQLQGKYNSEKVKIFLEKGFKGMTLNSSGFITLSLHIDGILVVITLT